MATELTAEAVWKMVKGIDIPKLCDTVGCLRYDPDGPYETVRGWRIATDYDGTLSPHQALALIVDAMKREMVEDWMGCGIVATCVTGKTWRAGFHKPMESYRHFDAPTESEAVIAAYLAWKEGR